MRDRNTSLQPEKMPKMSNNVSRTVPGKSDAPKKSGPSGPPPFPNLTPNWRLGVWHFLITLALLWIWQDAFHAVAVKTIPYSQFKQHLARGEVTECEIKESEIVGRITPKPESQNTESQSPQTAKAGGGESKSAAGSSTTTKKASDQIAQTNTKAASKQLPGKSSAKTADVQPFVFRTVRVDDPKLVEELQAASVNFAGVRPGILSYLLVGWILPIGVMVVIWVFLARRLGAGHPVMNIGKSRAKLIGEKETGVTFDDVAGCDEAKTELQEVVDFLQNPDRYRSIGAKIPKGVLLVGPPGTGKTLLAKAVAGEASVPFFSLSGSDFVEMFVGVGAARVRDLFHQATRQAPCIVFIDELDAIGRERGVHVGVGHDEREQTLNQLLVEMDGFEPNTGVILLAATNRPEVLDKALLRPGRFDRQVVVDAPDLDGREAILRVHARDKKLAGDVDLRRIAMATPGFSGADLANAMNEAALLAARRDSKTVSQNDLEDAVEKVVAGPERKSRRLEEDEKRRVAYHEVGHALVAAYSEHADPVHKISIIPRGRAALGYTMQLPTEQQFLSTRSDLRDRITGLLGGRAAEEIVFGEVSTGAQNDLERATELAREMVCMFGMSESVGLMHCVRRQPLYLPSADGSVQRDCSEHTAQQVDQEVRQILDDAYERAKSVLKEHDDQLETVTAELLKTETLDGTTFYRLIGKHAARASSNGQPVAAAAGV